MIEYDQPIKILCVGNEINVLRAISRVFLGYNFEILIADSGEAGIKILEEDGPFQVIISDYRMPGMNGVEFLRGVYEKWPETVRIVISGYADAGAIVSAINEGHIYKFIPKPWNDDELRSTIQQCLERYFLLKKNQELLEQLATANSELEEKVKRRIEQLELRNMALEFSQSLLGQLPVAVAGVDDTDMIAYCNDQGAVILQKLCGDIFGVSMDECCDVSFGEAVAQVREKGSVDVCRTIVGQNYRVMGRSFRYRGSKSVILLLIEI